MVMKFQNVVIFDGFCYIFDLWSVLACRVESNNFHVGLLCVVIVLFLLVCPSVCFGCVCLFVVCMGFFHYEDYMILKYCTLLNILMVHSVKWDN